MKNFTVCARSIKAAQLFKADRDSREYLTGVYIDTNGVIAATNGHILFKRDVSEHFGFEAPEKAGIYKIIGTIPKSAEKAVFALGSDGRTGVIKLYGKSSCLLGLLAFEIIDGKFPELERVIPNGDVERINAVGVNPKYLIVCGKALEIINGRTGSCSIRIDFVKGKGHTQALVSNLGYADDKTVMLVMLCRTER